MSTTHAVTWLDHQSARVLHLDEGDTARSTVKAHHHETRQHGSGVRTEHEFFANVCDSIANVGEVLITGPRLALADFRHYVEKHRNALSPRLVGWHVSDRQSDGQLIAMASEQFDRIDRMGLPATP